MSAVDWTAADFVCLLCTCLVVSVVFVCCTVPWFLAHTLAQVCALFVSLSSSCFMRTLSDSLRPLHLLHFLSLHFLYLPALLAAFHFLLPCMMSWITTTRTSAEELGPPDKKNSSTFWVLFFVPSVFFFVPWLFFLSRYRSRRHTDPVEGSIHAWRLQSMGCRLVQIVFS